eukprot:m.111371 g.111371  ORF g.111371 m.111371 type:complete len:106 (+) comp15295_c1_seq1:1567-1884(+)
MAAQTCRAMAKTGVRDPASSSCADISSFLLVPLFMCLQRFSWCGFQSGPWMITPQLVPFFFFVCFGLIEALPLTSLAPFPWFFQCFIFMLFCFCFCFDDQPACLG